MFFLLRGYGIKRFSQPNLYVKINVFCAFDGWPPPGREGSLMDVSVGLPGEGGTSWIHVESPCAR